jgi:hypothetical protein
MPSLSSGGREKTVPALIAFQPGSDRIEPGGLIEFERTDEVGREKARFAEERGFRPKPRDYDVATIPR